MRLMIVATLLTSSLFAAEICLENDLLHSSDKNYTNGIRASTTPAPGADGTADWWLRRMPAVGNDPVVLLSRVAAQQMYTPANIATPFPDPSDRPYAGWAYVGMRAQEIGERGVNTVTITGGLIGPGAQGERVQRTVHSVVGAQDPKGWSKQLGTEPTAQVSLRSARTFGTSFADLEPYVMAEAGNVLAAAGLGTQARVGYNIPSEFSDFRIGAMAKRRPSVYVVAGAELRAVGHNTLISGSMFGSGTGLNSNVLVYDLYGGVGTRIGRFHAALTSVVRSEEFDGQQDGPQEFNGVSIGFDF